MDMHPVRRAKHLARDRDLPSRPGDGAGQKSPATTESMGQATGSNLLIDFSLGIPAIYDLIIVPDGTVVFCDLTSVMVPILEDIV